MGLEVLLPILLVVLLFLMVNRGRKQQRQVQQLQASIVPGQRVMTTAGLYARIVEVGDTTVVLEPADGVRTTWSRQAIARLVDDEPTATAVDTDVLPETGVDVDTSAGTGTTTGTGASGASPAQPTDGTPDAPERPER
jgi:preprotein translocase subunit YajC